MIKIQYLNAKLLRIDKKSYKHINIYYIGYVTKKYPKYVNIHSVLFCNLLLIKKKDRNKYVDFASTDNNKEVLKKYTEISNGIKNLIEKVDNKPGEYEKDYTKIKFMTDYNLPLNKTLKFHDLTIIVTSVFQENNKYYPQIFLTNVCMSYKNDPL